MVTFRFYLVSVVAFFLALAVGVVVGSVLDGRIADSLQDRLDRVETSLDETVAAMDEKNREIDELDAYVEASAPYAVQDELLDTTSLVVVESGVDAGPVEDLVTRLRQAGSRVDGIVWLETDWALTDDERLEQLATIAGAQGSTPEAVRRSFWAALLDATDDAADDAAGTGDETTTTVEGTPGAGDATTTTVATTTTEEPPEPIELFSTRLLAEAEDAGLLRLQQIDGGEDIPGGELVVSVVTGTASSVDRPGEVAIEVAEEFAAAGRATTLSEVFVTPPADPGDRGELLSSLLGDGPLTFSTVDDLDRVSGRVATVLALSGARDEVFGRFGYGSGADAVLPPWQAP
ncbi:MAG: copper transporter [Actinomycetota bacterium]|nr:copper transporter [Actinomycetota bacterium]